MGSMTASTTFGLTGPAVIYEPRLNGFAFRLANREEQFEMDLQDLREKAGIKLKLPWWKRLFK